MLGLSALELVRFQFGFTISFHIIFPAITIGLASYLVVLEALWLWKKETVYRNLHLFWARIFARKHGLHARGRPVHHSDHPDLYRLVLSRVPRQGEGRRRLSPLMRSATDMRQTLRRAGWLVLIWTASVTAMGAIAFLFRLMMQASGLTL